MNDNSSILAYSGQSIFNFDVDSSQLEIDQNYNPNRNNFYAVEVDDYLDYDNPLHFLALIPNTTKEKKSSLTPAVYLLKFVNWAIYYYKKLSEEYSKKKRYKTNEEVNSSYMTAKSMAIMIQSIGGLEHILEDVQQAAQARDSKKDFELKPKMFLTLCELFARGWYDQHFFKSKHKKGTIEFAYYLVSPEKPQFQ